jgi:hypothetical protein
VEQLHVNGQLLEHYFALLEYCAGHQGYYWLVYHGLLNSCSVNKFVQISGLYYKLMTIVNDNSRVINKLEAYDARVIIYDRHMFIVQATGLQSLTNAFQTLNNQNI